MSWFKILIISWFMVEMLVGISRVGKPRDPITRLEAVAAAATWLAFAALVAVS